MNKGLKVGLVLGGIGVIFAAAYFGSQAYAASKLDLSLGKVDWTGGITDPRLRVNVEVQNPTHQAVSIDKPYVQIDYKGTDAQGKETYYRLATTVLPMNGWGSLGSVAPLITLEGGRKTVFPEELSISLWTIGTNLVQALKKWKAGQPVDIRVTALVHLNGVIPFSAESTESLYPPPYLSQLLQLVPF